LTSKVTGTIEQLEPSLGQACEWGKGSSDYLSLTPGVPQSINEDIEASTTKVKIGQESRLKMLSHDMIA
jgi:hypothetical protein